MLPEATTPSTAPAEKASNPNLQATLVAMRPAAPVATARTESRVSADLLNHINSHRSELESIDVRIASLDRSIELEQEKLRESKSNLEESYQARRDLMHLRLAMVHFVQELEATQIGD